MVPSDLRYTKDHEWVRVEGETATIGVTDFAATQLGADLTRPALMNILVNLHNFDTGIGAPITTSSADHLGMGQTMMLQICNNRFWRMTGWLSAGGPMDRVSNKGDCGWGY